jgi:predicted phage tail protein
MNTSGVPRIGRLLDLAGLVLFVVGGAVFGRAWLGFGAMRDYRPGPHDPLWAATKVANGFLRLQHIGVALMLAGVAVFVIAWWTARRVIRASTGREVSPASETPGA